MASKIIQSDFSGGETADSVSVAQNALHGNRGADAVKQIPAQPAMRKLVLLLGIPIDDLTMPEALDRLDAFVQIGRRTGKTHQVATVNVDFLVKATKDPELRLLLQEVDMATADGMPLVWGARKLGVSLEGRVAGSDLVPALAERAAARGYSIYFLGAAPGIAAEAANILFRKHPDLIVAGVHAPPFSSVLDMDPGMIDDIKAAQPDILLVAFGNPKQEKWIGMNRHQLGVPVMIGVGATLDFIVGNRRRAPLWMQRSGLEWLYRLIQEPSRMWRRYGVGLFVFSSFFARQWWRLRSASSSQLILPRSELMLIEDTAVIGIQGRLTIENLSGFANAANESLAVTPYLVVNCEKVEFLDSSAIGALVGLAKEARDAGGDLYLASVPPPIYQTLRLLRLDTFFIIFDDVASALESSLRDRGENTDSAPDTAEFLQGPVVTNWLVVEAPRRLDALTAAELEEVWTAQVENNPHVVVDCSTTAFLTSAGLALLGKLARLAKAQDGEVRVCSCSKDVHQVINMAGFNKVVTTYPDLDSALS